MQEQDLAVAFTDALKRSAKLRIEESAQFRMFAYAHRAGLGKLVDREVDQLAAMIGESESRSAIEPGQDSLRRNVGASAPGDRQDL